MKYIEKHDTEQRVVDYENQLREAQMDEASLKDRTVHPTSNGAAIYDMVQSMPAFPGLKQQLFDDQGGICCYCGQKLLYEGHPYQPQFIVEHVFPKEADRTLAGEYHNMLLSCRPADKEEQSRAEAPRKERATFFHCDKSKDCRQITYTPLLKDVSTHFSYDEFGNVIPMDEIAEDDCETLNLNCSWLVKRRCAAIEGRIYDEQNQLLSDDELRLLTTDVMKRDENNQHQEFCFAIKGAAERLLGE